jgi:hypothetical protein
MFFVPDQFGGHVNRDRRGGLSGLGFKQRKLRMPGRKTQLIALDDRRRDLRRWRWGRVTGAQQAANG